MQGSTSRSSRHPRRIAAAASCWHRRVWIRWARSRRSCSTSRDATSTVVVDRQRRAAVRGAVGRRHAQRAARRGDAAADPRGGDDRGRGSALLVASRRRSRCASLRALKRNLVERRVVEGGSTITQQVAKLLLAAAIAGAQARGLAREDARGGARAAARARFDEARDPRALPEPGAVRQPDRRRRAREPAPTSAHDAVDADAGAGGVSRRRCRSGRPRFNPYRGTAPALARQRDGAAADGGGRRCHAGPGARGARRAAGASTRAPAPFVAPHFVEMVLAASGGQRAGAHRDDARRRAAARRSTASSAATRGRSIAHGAANVAVVVLDNATRRVAGVGRIGRLLRRASTAARSTASIAPRQPGSALKPFTYALAFEEGRHAGDRAARRAVALSDRRSRRPLQPAQLRRPVPRAAAGAARAGRLGERAGGRARVRARRAERCCASCCAPASPPSTGTPSYYGLGLTLGNAEVRLDELVAAYAAFARGGEWLAPTWRLARRCPRGSGPAPARCRRAPRIWITDILSDAEAREYIFGRGGSLEFPFPVAVKTGTSQAYHDNWTVGYTRDVTVGVWVGNFDRTPLRNSSGVTGAGPIFHAVMLAAQRRAGGTQQRLRRCGARRRRPTASSSARSARCRACRRTRGARRAPRVRAGGSGHRAVQLASPGDEGLLTVWPPEYREWARTAGLASPSRGHSGGDRRPTRDVRRPPAAPPWRSPARRAARPT